MTDTHVCPRRAENPGPWKYDTTDTWTTGRGLIGQDDVGPSCSYCGSLHPDRFMELIRDGWIVGPTDKNYKAYLARPYTADEIAARKARWFESDAMAVAIRSLGERDGKTAEQIQADLEQQWASMVEPLETGGQQEAKFYYQHLSDEQRAEFISLVNSGQMRIGYPGHFYRLPFFTRAVAA